MDKKLPTVTIGIAAYNEEGNIGYVLADAEKQISDGSFVIHEIVVVSDGSTDKTDEIVLRSKDPRTRLVRKPVRSGVMEAENTVFDNAKGDMLVFLNADISIPDASFVQKMVRPILDDKADLVSAHLEELPPKTFIEKVIHASMQYKKRVFARYNNGNHIFNCRGPARAFSKELYTNMRFVNTIADDMYSYLYAIQHGYRFMHVREAEILYKLPDNLSDHFRQSIRFFQSWRQSWNVAHSIFKEDIIKKHTTVPAHLFIREMPRAFVRNPIHFTMYPIITASTSLVARLPFIPDLHESWKNAKSSKYLRFFT